MFWQAWLWKMATGKTHARCCILLVSAVVVAIGGCTFNTRGVPARVASIESEMQAGGNSFGYSYSVFVASSPLATISGSANHVVGQNFNGLKTARITSYRSKLNSPALSFAAFDGGCRMQNDLALEFRSLLDTIFQGAASSYPWQQVNLHIGFLPQGHGLERKFYAVHPGRRADFYFYFACDPDSSTRDEFFAFLTSSHELSHAMSHLLKSDRQSDLKPWTIDQETLAEGAPACIYEALKNDGDPLSLSEQLSEKTYFESSWETATIPEPDRKPWCDRWQLAMQGHLPQAY